MKNRTRRLIGTGLWVALFLLAGGCGSGSEPGPGKLVSGARPGLEGIGFTEALINLEQGDLDSFGGWRPNDLIFGKLFDDRNNEELGRLAVVKESVEVLKEDIARVGALDTFLPELTTAEAAFDSDPYKMWPPSAETRIKEGIVGLKSYRDAIIQGEARFYPRPENLSLLLNHYVTALGDAHERLLAPVGYFKTDNNFYYSRGVAEALDQLYTAMLKDFAGVIQTRGLGNLLSDAQVSIELAAKMDPWIVLDGKGDSLRANHRLNMDAYLNEARTKTYLMLEILKQTPTP